MEAVRTNCQQMADHVRTLYNNGTYPLRRAGHIVPTLKTFVPVTGRSHKSGDWEMVRAFRE
jgi:hypothetical protein